MSVSTGRGDLAASNLCPCEACQHITDLDIKVIVHRGAIMRYELRGLEDLSGVAVIEAHRLLKNSLGRDRYVLVSETASADVELPWERAPAVHVEPYDDVGEVRCDVYFLDDGQAADDGAVSRVRDLAGKLASNARTLAGRRG